MIKGSANMTSNTVYCTLLLCTVSCRCPMTNSLCKCDVRWSKIVDKVNQKRGDGEVSGRRLTSSAPNKKDPSHSSTDLCCVTNQGWIWCRNRTLEVEGILMLVLETQKWYNYLWYIINKWFASISIWILVIKCLWFIHFEHEARSQIVEITVFNIRVCAVARMDVRTEVNALSSWCFTSRVIRQCVL